MESPPESVSTLIVIRSNYEMMQWQWDEDRFRLKWNNGAFDKMTVPVFLVLLRLPTRPQYAFLLSRLVQDANIFLLLI